MTFYSQTSDDLSLAWDEMLSGIEFELQGVYECVDGPKAASTSGRGEPLVTKLVQTKWQPPLRRVQHGPELRAWMVALRWVAHCRRVKEYIAKQVDALLIWQDGCRILNSLADHSKLAKALAEFVCYTNGVRRCAVALEALPAWCSEFFLSDTCFQPLACDGFEEFATRKVVFMDLLHGN